MLLPRKPGKRLQSTEMSAMRDHESPWSFLGREENSPDDSLMRSSFYGKRILITGAGGFIGSALARALSRLSFGHLLLLDVVEPGLHELGLDLDRDARVSYDLIVGDVCDPSLLTEVFGRHRPQIVLHAAACKHVSLMEDNPFTATTTNVWGTQQLTRAVEEFGADQLMLVSTDNAGRGDRLIC